MLVAGNTFVVRIQSYRRGLKPESFPSADAELKQRPFHVTAYGVSTLPPNLPPVTSVTTLSLPTHRKPD
jgi:hypothetical protein